MFFNNQNNILVLRFFLCYNKFERKRGVYDAKIRENSSI